MSELVQIIGFNLVCFAVCLIILFTVCDSFTDILKGTAVEVVAMAILSVGCYLMVG